MTGSPLPRGALLALALTLLTGLPAAPADARPGERRERARVHGSDDMRRLEFTPRLETRRDRARARRAGRLSFEARGRRFDLDLRENDALLDRLPGARREALRARHEVYRGELEDRPGSWVRLTRSGRRWQGLVFDGEELLAVEPAAGRVATVMYRARDVEMTGSCALDPQGTPLPGLAGLDGEPGELPPSLAATATSELEITLVGDLAFSQEQADPEGAALAVMNAVDGLYTDQVGVSIRVVELLMLQDDAGLSSNDAGVLIDQLTDLTGNGSIPNPGLVHLLTGRNLNGSTIGIAYLGVLCHNRYGVGLSEHLSNVAATTILVAHEIGHNFGAPHDNQSGSACASTPGSFVMNPYLNGAADEFSACSLSQMEQEIASASCLVPVEDEIEPDPVPACSNGIDDDGDGSIDFGSLEFGGDIGCTHAEDASEEAECRDGLDNDGDGMFDYPEDPECMDEHQWSESDPACGIGFEIVPFLAPLLALRRKRGDVGLEV